MGFLSFVIQVLSSVTCLYHECILVLHCNSDLSSFAINSQRAGMGGADHLNPIRLMLCCVHFLCFVQAVTCDL